MRPANFPRAAPGRGHLVVERDGLRLARRQPLRALVFVEAARSPFAEADAILADLRGKADYVLVDFHAEATSEKVAMGWHLDGRVTACVGTHTHVPTADARVLPGGTAYVTDVGMTGPRGGVIGVKREQALQPLPDHGPHPVRDLRRGPVAERRADRGRRRRAGDVDRAAAEARRMSFEAYEIDLHGHEMVYRRAGSGPPVVLIHGMVNSSRHWEKTALLLAERYSVIAPDLIGHGDSAGPRGDYSLGAHASRIRDLLAVLGIDRATMVGHSYGGGVAMQFFWQFPQRTERLALISSGGLGPEVSPMLRSAALPGAVGPAVG